MGNIVKKSPGAAPRRHRHAHKLVVGRRPQTRDTLITGAESRRISDVIGRHPELPGRRVGRPASGFPTVAEIRASWAHIGRGSILPGRDEAPDGPAVDRKALLAACHGRGPDETLGALRALYCACLRVRLLRVEQGVCSCGGCTAVRIDGRGWVGAPFSAWDVSRDLPPAEPMKPDCNRIAHSHPPLQSAGLGAL